MTKPQEPPHDDFIPNTLYIAIYNDSTDGVERTNLGMMFCAVTSTAGTYFIASPRPADGKYILNMTSTYHVGMSITEWHAIGLRPVQYRETTTANGNVNGVRRDITTGESWLWTARLLNEFGKNTDPTINWKVVIPLVVKHMHVMSEECIENMLDAVEGLRAHLGLPPKPPPPPSPKPKEIKLMVFGQ